MQKRGPTTVPRRTYNATREGKAKHTMNREPGDLPYTVKMSLRKEGFFGYITRRAFLFFYYQI